MVPEQLYIGRDYLTSTRHERSYLALSHYT
jgi:hypothetical protein